MTDAASSEPKVLYCIRHGESMYNEWRKRSLLNFSWIYVRDPMIFDSPLTSKGQKEVSNEYGNSTNANCYTKARLNSFAKR